MDEQLYHDTVERLLVAAQRHYQMMEMIFPQVAWGASCLSGEALQELNEAPIQLHNAIVAMEKEK